MATSVTKEGDRVDIRFKDTGPGISKTYFSRLCDPFFTTKEVGPGVGLGLSISYGIIQKHRGPISVKQTGPKGTTFVLELPAYKEPQKISTREAT